MALSTVWKIRCCHSSSLPFLIFYGIIIMTKGKFFDFGPPMKQVMIVATIVTFSL